MRPALRYAAFALLLAVPPMLSACSSTEPVTPSAASSTSVGNAAPTTTTAAASNPATTAGASQGPKQAPKPDQACTLVSPAMLTRIFGATVPKGDNTTAGPFPTTCEWKQGTKQVFVEITGDSGYETMKKNPDLTWSPYDGAGVDAIASDTFRKDGKEVGLKLAKGTLTVQLRPNPVDPALLLDLVHDVIANAPAA
jgi:hypothetical protein